MILDGGMLQQAACQGVAECRNTELPGIDIKTRINGKSVDGEGRPESILNICRRRLESGKGQGAENATNEWRRETQIGTRGNVYNEKAEKEASCKPM